MNFLTDMPGRSRFAVDYDQYMEMPVVLRDKMAERIAKWRVDENKKK